MEENGFGHNRVHSVGENNDVSDSTMENRTNLNSERISNSERNLQNEEFEDEYEDGSIVSSLVDR